MTELEKIEYAKTFIDKLANGINPLDDSHVPDGDIVNNVRLSRCFFYISDILRQVIDNGGVSVKKTSNHHKKSFILTEEEKSKIRISDKPIPVSEIANHLNSIIDVETTNKISAALINKWLLSIGLLETVDLPDGKTRRTPTTQGIDIGMIAEERAGQYGSYIVVLHSPESQQFIYDNIDAVVAYKCKKDSEALGLQGQPWSTTHEECLVDLFKKNVPVAEIAATLKRTRGGVRARLKKLGLIENRSDAN